jgi:RNA polymerase sigma factor (sigma-70 family)
MASSARSAVLRPIFELFDEGTLTGLSDEELVTRFVAGRDERAFEALVVRHGRTVLAVCHDLLRDRHDAEDAFQATFLILARKARSLWVRGSLAPWLHRVARRVAVEANQRKARRQRFERTGLAIDMPELEAAGHWKALLETLHEEINRLPEKYRAPIILCDLESRTRDEAAHQLGWQPGTVAGRLARARSILRDRIGRRENVDAGGFATVIAAYPASVREVPRSLIENTAKLALSCSKRKLPMSELASFAGAELAGRVARAMILTKLSYSAAMLFAAGLALAVIASGVAGARPEAKPIAGASVLSERTQAKPSSGRPDGVPDKVPLAGAIVLQGGGPAKGARVFFSTIDHAHVGAEVRAETITNDGGQFHVEIPPVDVPWAGFVGTGTLWAYQPGTLVAWMPVYRGALPPGLPQRLALGPATRAPFEVLNPDGKTVAGAMIEPRSLTRDNTQVPDRLASIIGGETVTDARGRAVMTAFFPEEITAIRVRAEGYGQQEFSFGPERFDRETKVVKLRAVGGLKGRLTGDQDAVRHRALQVSSFSSPDDPIRRSHTRMITTDENGRFDLPELPVGPHGIRTVPGFDFGWWARSAGLLEVETGKTAEVVLSLKRAVRVRGVVREKGTGMAIAGVRVALSFAETGAMTSGQDGAYAGYVPPGPIFITARYIPAGYARPLYGPRQVVIRDDAVEYDLPPLEFTKAGEVPGLVVDELSRRVAGAEVEASWTLDEERAGTGPHHLSVRTGPDGRFVFQGVPLAALVSLSARHRDLRAIEPSPAHVGDSTTLRLRPSNCVAMGGRILDASGRPLPGANVHLRSRNRGPAIGQNLEEGLVVFEGGFVLVTDADGRFQTPKELEPSREYTAYANAKGYGFNRTGWTTTLTQAFPDMKLQPYAAR